MSAPSYAEPFSAKVMPLPASCGAGGSGSTEGGAEEAMYTQIATYNNSHVLLVRCHHLVQHAHPVAYSSLASKVMCINTNTICSSHTKCLNTLSLLQGRHQGTLLCSNRAPIAVAAPCPSCWFDRRFAARLRALRLPKTVCAYPRSGLFLEEIKGFRKNLRPL